MKIALTQDKYAQIDPEDYKALSQFKWHVTKEGYAARSQGYGTTYMHRLIMNTPDGMHTDHINHDRLDNRKANLRVCTHAENLQNQRKRGTVHAITVKGHKYFVGVVKVNYKRYQTTTCATKEMAEGALKQMIIDKNL